MTTNYQDRKLLKETAEKLSTKKVSKNILMGFDGFVDEIIHVVDKRLDEDNFNQIDTISKFGKRISDAAGLSANIELVPAQIKLGGNGPINANALIEQGHKITYIGCLGSPHISEVFMEFSNSCEKVISIAEPGHTDALEFDDGKLMFGKHNSLPQVNWKNLTNRLSNDEIKDLLVQSDLLSINNWTMLTHMNGIIEGLFSIMKDIEKKPGIFIDLADPQKRTEDDIKGILKLLSKIGQHTEIIFSMNKKESIDIGKLLNVKEEDTINRAVKMREAMDISHVVIHPLQGAACATKNWAGYVVGPYTKKPKLTTGAGDNFNAGFCNAWLHNLSPEACLAAGVNTSGYYVRNATSPNKKQLIHFMQERSK